MGIQGMKKLLTLALLSTSLSAFGLGFPVFIGNQNNYITNRGDNTWAFVITNKIVCIWQGNLNIGAVAEQFLADVTILGPLTNTASGIFANAGIYSQAYANTITTVSGVGGANTNFTFQASDAETHVDAGTTNVNIVAIMGGTNSFSFQKHIVFTNRTATSRTISFSSTSNSWVALQEYDGITNAGPITVTNGQAVYMWLKVRGSNVAYAYKPARNPAN